MILKSRFIAIFLLFAAGLLSCRNAGQKSPEKELAEGFQLLEMYCFSCHSPDATIDQRIAPPMIAVKRHYIDEGTSREELIEAMSNFMENPMIANSKMPNAIEKFGIMPKMILPEEQIEKIATYIYETELEAPGWFEAHYQEEHGKYTAGQSEESLNYLQQGQKIAMQTQAVLGKNLLGSIQQKGVETAITFCNEQAYPLTDSMAKLLGASIRRVSDQPRNPNNQASADELNYIIAAKGELAQGERIIPRVKEVDGHMIGYYPITTNAMCLQCHGQTESQILPSTLERIHRLYPDDQAIGYDENQLRGIWVVSMDKPMVD